MPTQKGRFMNQLTKTEAGAVALAAFNTDLAQIQLALQENTGVEGLTDRDFPRIKVPAGGSTVWTVATLEGEIQVPMIEGVVVAWSNGRAYYVTKFGEGDGNRPPDCFSNNGLVGIGAPGGACVSCPLAQYGSAENNAQACRQFRSLFVLRGENMLPDVLVIPPTSVKLHRKFNLKLSSVGVPHYAALANFTLRRTKNAKGVAYSEVVFGVSRKLTQDEIGKAKQYADMFASIMQPQEALDVLR